MFNRTKVIKVFLAFLVLGSLTGCTDFLLQDTVSMNQPHGHYSSYNYHYSAPRPPVRHVQANRYIATHNHYYHDPEYHDFEPVYYQPLPRPRQVPVYTQPAPRRSSSYYSQRAPRRSSADYTQTAPRRSPSYSSEQAQIASDRALAQRLQNEEYARAHRQAEQIASDRALAERLQAEEYARAAR